jgi:purine-nucleoside/S-methyl-5'-thioadenosine phosphorylase / adenosine deaminase
VGDDPIHVKENRHRLSEVLKLPTEPVWLKQLHGTHVVNAAVTEPDCEADASFTRQAGVVCAVLTADCLPVLLCDDDGERVAVMHAGWRGLLNGVIENCVRCLDCPGSRLLAWLGPAIGPTVFEVGEEVRGLFLAEDPNSSNAFQPSPRGRWFANIYALAKQRLARVHVTEVFGGKWCTMEDAERFYSYRRDGVTGRMASLIWLDNR